MSELDEPTTEFDAESAYNTVAELAQAAFKAGDVRFALLLEDTGRDLISALSGSQSTHSRFRQE